MTITRTPSCHPSTRTHGRRLPRARTILPLLAVVPLAAPAAADAKTVRSDNVVLHRMNDVSCLVVQRFEGSSNQGIECSSPAVPRTDLDGYVELHRTGRAKLGERGDFPGYTTKRRTLRVGDVWRPGRSAKGIVCTYEPQGLKCRNRSRHGFVVTSDALRRF